VTSAASGSAASGSAASGSAASAAALAHVRALGGSPPPAGLFDRAVITVNFHPDRLSGSQTVAARLARDGVYRSQFETGISNGKVGGLREVWEDAMFGGAYRGEVAGRPLYGGLNLAGYVDGASPRFGSCYLVLKPAVSARATFSHGDSVTEPTVVGTADTFGSIWAALLDEVARTGRALNLPASSPSEWIAALSAPRPAPGRAMDDYVETQIHGGLTLGADVTAVVADPSFRGTDIAALLGSVAPSLRWHPGFVLAPGDFPADLRDPIVPRLAAHVASRYGVDHLDAEVIGRAARSIVREPATWTEFGPPAEALQLVKYLWHLLVLLGEPAAA
jgi:Protein of unknown function (DUF3626)